MRQRLVLHALTLLMLATPAAASADALLGFGQIQLNSAEFSGELADEFIRMPIAWHLGGGLRYRDIALSAGLDFGPVRVADEARHGRDPFSTGLSSDLRYYVVHRDRGMQPYVRLGLGYRWISGTGPVTRWCSESSTCTAGFFTAEPSYSSVTTRVGVGVQYSVMTADGFYAGVWLDAGYEAISAMEVVERVPRGGLLGITLGAAIGGGRTR